MSFIRITIYESGSLNKFLINIECSSGHPRTKHDTAYRLSRSGLAIVYGQKVEFQGPIV